MKNVRKCIKGFDSNLKCRGFQYEIGKEYKLPEGEHVSICKCGFHAIDEDENPLNVFKYYSPCDENGKPSRYCEVEIGGETKKHGSKIVGSEIKIVREIGIEGVIEAHNEWVKHHSEVDVSEENDDYSSASNTGYRSSASNTGDGSVASNTGDGSVASNTGDGSVASNTGDGSVASNTGYNSVASNTGNGSVASNTGNYSSASNTGNNSVASNTGNYSSASNTGYCSSASNTGHGSSASNTGNNSVASNTGWHSSASNTGDCSIASNTGHCSSAEVSGKDSVAVGVGYESKAKGALGCAIVVAERGKWNGSEFPLIGGVFAIVDGVNIKADTWYTCKNGELVEIKEN